MATYKVIQDIEAEDKLIGPLTLRQFIYAGIGAVFLYLSYVLATRGAAFMLVIFLPIAAVAGFFAFPWMRDQPTEVWALAKIRFILKPRKRIWNQSGVKELVTITVPKQLVTNFSNGLSQSEVRSRLRALATTIDTRGWAVKNANLNLATQGTVVASDRLIAPTRPVPTALEADVRASDDILDEKNNANAQRLQSMIDQKAKAHRSELVANLNKETPKTPKAPAANDYWFLNQPTTAAKIPNNMVTFSTQVVTPGSDDNGASSPAADEASILAELDAHKDKSTGAYYGHMHTISPLSKQGSAPVSPVAQPTPQPATPPPAMPATPAPTPVPQNANAPVTPQGQAAILQLASNNDLDVATIAREAGRAAPQSDEVVIKLH